MTKTTQIVQASARSVSIPSVLAVGPAVLELASERTSNAGSHSRRFAARWSKGRAEGNAFVDLRPTSKDATEIAVTIGAPRGPKGLLWPRPVRRRLANLFACALAYQIETRTIEEADQFDVRRTSAERVRARMG